MDCKQCGEELPDHCSCSVAEFTSEHLKISATQLLELAAECMKERGKQYETDPSAPSSERSMERIVQAFNAVSGKGLTVREGWLFMVILKLVRMRASPKKLDNYVDAVAYAALLGDASELS